MTTPISLQAELLSLSPADRFDTAQFLLDSLRDDLLASPLTPEELVRVRATLAGIDNGTIVCEPFDAVMRELRGQ